jgi:hypothetical protein
MIKLMMIPRIRAVSSLQRGIFFIGGGLTLRDIPVKKNPADFGSAGPDI